MVLKDGAACFPGATLHGCEGRRPRRSWRHVRLAPLLVLGLLGAPLAAQGDAGVVASGDGSLGIQALAGETIGTAGARLWLHFGPVWRVGFGGVRGLDRSDGSGLAASGLEARFGMATVTLARRLPLPLDVEASIALGSGAVSLENTVVGTTLDTETVWVVEPAVRWPGLDVGPLLLGGELAYRWTLGAEGLSRLDASDLRSLSLSVVASFRAR